MSEMHSKTFIQLIAISGYSLVYLFNSTSASIDTLSEDLSLGRKHVKRREQSATDMRLYVYILIDGFLKE